jgi:hypothetical protein
MGFLYNVRKAVWGEPAATKAERRLIVKIDAFILTYVCLMVSAPRIRNLGRALIRQSVLGQLS